MFAIVRTGGKQVRVEEGARIEVEKLPGEKGDQIVLDDVLLVSANGDLTLGQPNVENASVMATILEQGRRNKVLVYKYKRRNKYRRKKGHRQPFTALEIDEININ